MFSDHVGTAVSVFDKLILDTQYKGETVLLFHGEDLEQFFNRAKTWLRSSVALEDYNMQFITNPMAENIIRGVTGQGRNLEYAPNILLVFRNYDDATLFKLAMA